VGLRTRHGILRIDPRHLVRAAVYTPTVEGLPRTGDTTGGTAAANACATAAAAEIRSASTVLLARS
jgi:hypothetical protein